MPQFQEWTPFKRKDIAKAFFDLDISDSEPSTASQTPKPRDRNRLIASKPPLDEAKVNDKVTLLTLPTEIRLRIYNLLVVSQFDRTQNPSSAVGNTNQKMILLHMGQFRQYRTMEPAILQTCKQIYHEANSILYSQNVFAMSEPKQMLRLIEQIGLVNLKLVKTLHIWVPWTAELFPWLRLLNILAEESSGLRSIKIGWGMYFECPGQLQRGVRERGLGDNLDFVRALGRIRGLEKLVMRGYYSEKWPAYLEERMGVRVQATRGHYREVEELGLKEGDLSDEDLKFEKKIREMNDNELLMFQEYQEGTEDLIP